MNELTTQCLRNAVFDDISIERYSEELFDEVEMVAVIFVLMCERLYFGHVVTMGGTQ